jgi:hypothetical protein
MKCSKQLAIAPLVLISCLLGSLAQAEAPTKENLNNLFPQKKGSTVNKIINNFDGSITIQNPKLQYAGSLLSIATTTTDVRSFMHSCGEPECFVSWYPVTKNLELTDSIQGICKLLSKTKFKDVKQSSNFQLFYRGLLDAISDAGEGVRVKQAKGLIIDKNGKALETILGYSTVVSPGQISIGKVVSFYSLDRVTCHD